VSTITDILGLSTTIRVSLTNSDENEAKLYMTKSKCSTTTRSSKQTLLSTDWSKKRWLLSKLAKTSAVCHESGKSRSASLPSQGTNSTRLRQRA